VKEAFRQFMQCQIFILKGEVYSKGEELSEFSPDRLRFLLVSYYLAELSQLLVDDRRLEHLLRAKKLFMEYLEEV
jgi:hypothetical protein